MYGVNKVMLIGHLGADPEKMIYGTVRKVSFSLAVNEPGVNKDRTVTEHTEWISITCWNDLADLAEKLLKKGTLIYVEGKLRTFSWENKDGENRKTTSVNMERFVVLSPRDSSKNRMLSLDEKPSGSEILEDMILNEEEVRKLRDLPF